jgi:hypothetical protein
MTQTTGFSIETKKETIAIVSMIYEGKKIYGVTEILNYEIPPERQPGGNEHGLLQFGVILDILRCNFPDGEIRLQQLRQSGWFEKTFGNIPYMENENKPKTREATVTNYCSSEQEKHKKSIPNITGHGDFFDVI